MESEKAHFIEGGQNVVYYEGRTSGVTTAHDSVLTGPPRGRPPRRGSRGRAGGRAGDDAVHRDRLRAPVVGAVHLQMQRGEREHPEHTEKILDQ